MMLDDLDSRIEKVSRKQNKERNANRNWFVFKVDESQEVEWSLSSSSSSSSASSSFCLLCRVVVFIGTFVAIGIVFVTVVDTVVGMLTDMHAFYQYDRREQSMHDPAPEQDQ